MGKIGGNKSAIIQIKVVTQDEFGIDNETWVNAVSPFKGWLDLSSGDSPSVNYNAKIQESTHVFICDYFPLLYQVEGQPDEKITSENSRMVIGDDIYEVTLYDDPMELHQQLEIYLKFIGG